MIPVAFEHLLSPFGRLRLVSTRHRPGSRARSWCLKTADGCTLYLKLHASLRSFGQERHALSTWAPWLGGEYPRILAVDTTAGALVLSEVPGRPSRTPPDRTVFRAAGRKLRRLHELAHDDRDTMTVAEAHRHRMGSWLSRARAVLEHATVEAVGRALSTLELTDVRRVPCHRDYLPYNWLIVGEDAVNLVDFEHARADVAAIDLARVWAELGNDHDRWSAFAEGYGELEATAKPRLLPLGILHALATTTWALEHRDRARAIHGRRMLARLMHRI